MAGDGPFEFPVEVISGPQIRLQPLIIEKHLPKFWDATGSSSEFYAYTPMGPFETQEAMSDEFTNRWVWHPSNQLYAIMTSRKSKDSSGTTDDGEYAFAGLAGWLDASKQHLKAEIGPVMIIPSYQGTGLGVPVVKLMIQHAFKSVAEGGFGLRRVQWVTNTANIASMKLAERAGFQKEGVTRWHMLFANGQARGKIGNGRPVPAGSNSGDLGRDTIVYSLCWDD